MKIAGLKLFMDGAYSNRTAWTEDPYPGSDDHGMHTLADDDLRDAVTWARRNKIQVAVHAMGDRAINHVLDMFADEEPWMGELPSIRIDHATLFSRGMIDRINAARMSFAVVSHSIFLFAEYDSYQRNLSPQPIRDRLSHQVFLRSPAVHRVVLGHPGDRLGGRRQRVRVDQGGRAAAGLQRRRHRPGRGGHRPAGAAALHRPSPAGRTARPMLV